jgi:predicted ABC-type ATPase
MPSTPPPDEAAAPRVGAPSVVVLGGPNGAGKTTLSSTLKRVFEIGTFVNADIIATGLGGEESERRALRAGRLMLEELDRLARQRESFIFESTLSSRTFAPWLRKLAADGYEVHLTYEMSMTRVRARVARGGHSIPDDVIRRRYARSCANLVGLYLPLAMSWRIYDNSGENPQLVGYQTTTGTRVILLQEQWSTLHETAAKVPKEVG